MQYLPLFLDLKARPVLLVGAGEVALRKLETLVRAEAQVTIVALEVHAEVAALVAAHPANLQLERRAFASTDLTARWLVVAATADTQLHQRIAKACDLSQTWLNVVDQTALCSAIFPSIVDRDPVLVAISTGGSSPTLARMVRGWIEDRLPQTLGRLASFIGAKRRDVSAALPQVMERQHFWEKLLAGPLQELVLRDNTEAAEAEFKTQLTHAVDPARERQGSVALVGAGPGDPELMTLKGLRLIRSADVLFYDNLANSDLLEFARRDAEKIYVGKKRAFAGIRQDEINALLLASAQAGKQVVRLKGGDPFIFGRGGEEIQVLADHGIDFTVVPGISAALGGASYAGIPLTHRNVSQSVRFVTGHRSSDRTNMDWPELAKPGQTLVIYMGLPGLSDIMVNLQQQGLPASTPAALIQRATLDDQLAVVGTVASLPKLVESADVRGPTLIIVGEVVRYRVAGNMQMPTFPQS
jgi:uroporphyrin-III C-methyltransferase/precorrin-2 dehydrogenase/sirohydrochlorin ferrochelatase